MSCSDESVPKDNSLPQEADDRFDLDAWLHQKRLRLSSKGTRNLCKLLQRVYGQQKNHADEIIRTVGVFINTVIEDQQELLYYLYPRWFVCQLLRQADDLKELRRSFSSKYYHLFFYIFSELLRTQVKIYEVGAGVVRSVRIGEDHMFKLTLLKSESKFFHLVSTRPQDFPSENGALLGSRKSVLKELSIPIFDSEAEEKPAQNKALSVQQKTPAIQVSTQNFGQLNKNSESFFNTRSQEESTSSNSFDNKPKLHQTHTHQNFLICQPELALQPAEPESFNDFSAALNSTIIHPHFRDKIIHEDKAFRRGVIKFYNEAKEFGFILANKQEFFVHKDDLVKAGMNLADLDSRTHINQRKVDFRVIEYHGKNKIGKKAIDVRFV